MKTEEKITGSVADFVAKHHKIIFIAGIVLLVLSIISAGNIKVKTRMKDMLNEDDPKVQTYTELEEVFAGGTFVLVTIEGSDKKQMIGCAEAYVTEVRGNQNLMNYIRAINLKLDKDFVTRWGLMLQKASDLKKTGETFSKLNLLPFITSLNDSFEQTYTRDEAEEELETSKQENEVVSMLNQLESFFTLLKTYLENPEFKPLERQAETLAETFIYGDRYSFNFDNTMLIFTIAPNFNATDFDSIMAMMTEIKSIQKDIQKQFPNLKIVYTGDVPIQADEQDALTFDMLVPAVVAVILILLLFFFSFNQLRSIVFIVISLIIGIILTYGFLGLTIKEINMLTSVMTVLLIGLGVDYGIQVVTNFTTFRADGNNPGEALRKTYKKAGMGIMLAALTTAVAFFVMAATGSKAFSQFGVVMGMGIIMCFLVMIFFLPAILLWFGKKDVSSSRIPNINYNFLSKLGSFTNRYKWTTIVLGIIATAGLLFAAFTNQYEYDMMSLEPQDMPSIVQYRKVMEKFDMTPFASMVIAESIDEARHLTRALEKNHLVAEVNSIANFIPSDEEQEARLAEISRIHNMPARYGSFTYTESDALRFAGEIQRLEWNIIEMGDLSVAGLGEDNKILKKRNSMIREIFGAETGKQGKEVFQKLIKLIEQDPSLYANALSQLDAYFAREMDMLISAMAGVERKITIDDLPDSILRGFLDESKKRNLVMIYPKPGLFEHVDNIQKFNDELEKVSPKITGSTQILITWMNEVNSASKKAALYIFAAVVIPLVIGMGIDFGIHISHRFKIEQNIETVYSYTGKGVFLSGFTTMIGFGSLAMIGSFSSIASIGAILFLGIAACLATTLIILPALLAFGKSKARVMDKRIKYLSIGIFLLCSAITAFTEEDALSIIRKADEKAAISSSKSELSMLIYPNVNDEKNVRELRILSFGVGDEDAYMEFLSPKSIKGLKLLSKGGNQWIYFASTGRKRKIASTSKSKKQSVKGVGGDFSYEDLSGGKLDEKYNFKILESSKKEWVLEGKPKNADSVYSKIIIYVDKSSYLVSKIEYYTEEEGHYKDLVMEDVKFLGGKKIATKMTMLNLDKGSKTVVIIHNAEYDIPIDSINEKYFNPNRFYK